MDFINSEIRQDIVEMRICFEKQIKILDKIEILDKELHMLSDMKRPDMNRFHEKLKDKDILLAALNDLSEESSMRLSSLTPYLQNNMIQNNPDFCSLLALIKAVQIRINKVCDQEDTDYLHITNNLIQFRDVLVKELSVRDIPLSHRQIIL